MKTLNLKFIFPLLTAVLFLSSCVTAPDSISFSNSTIEVPFYETGSSSTPTVEWNKDRGTFLMDRTIPGVSINNQTGVISWNKDLELGQTSVGVIAENSEGSASTNIILDHQFAGNFEGGYNTDPGSTVLTFPNFELDFRADGTLVANNGGTLSVEGSWQLNPGNQITGSYVYFLGDLPFVIAATLTYSDNQRPKIKGTWGDEGAAVASGYLELEL